MLKTLTVVLKGGLGNQLIQYFTGLNIARELNCDLVLDTSWYARSIERNGLLSKRYYSLTSYRFGDEIHEESLFHWRNSPRTERFIRFVPKEIGHWLGVVEEFDGTTSTRRKKLLTFGHWIDKPRLPSMEQARSLLVDGLKSPSSDYLELAEQMEEEGITAVHIRLQDYVNFQEVYGEFSIDYLRMALKSSKEAKTNNSQLWLFSDDPELASEIMRSIRTPDKVVDESYELSDAENLALMSHATTLIGSNSTFSWWSAYSSCREKAEIFFPKMYTTSKKFKETGLFVNTWNYI